MQGSRSLTDHSAWQTQALPTWVCYKHVHAGRLRNILTQKQTILRLIHSNTGTGRTQTNTPIHTIQYTTQLVHNGLSSDWPIHPGTDTAQSSLTETAWHIHCTETDTTREKTLPRSYLLIQPDAAWHRHCTEQTDSGVTCDTILMPTGLIYWTYGHRSNSGWF